MHKRARRVPAPSDAKLLCGSTCKGKVCSSFVGKSLRSGSSKAPIHLPKTFDFIYINAGILWKLNCY
jgi:hypothetical protein